MSPRWQAYRHAAQRSLLPAGTATPKGTGNRKPLQTAMLQIIRICRSTIASRAKRERARSISVARKEDLRLVPAALTCWAAAAMGIYLPLLPILLIDFGIFCLTAVGCVLSLRSQSLVASILRQAVLVFSMALMLLVISAAITGVRLPAVLREAVARHTSVEVEVRLTTAPGISGDPASANLVSATVERVFIGGAAVLSNLPVLLSLDPRSNGLEQGDLVRTIGRLTPTDPRSPTSFILTPTIVPSLMAHASGPLGFTVELRRHFIDASHQLWSESWPDSAALLPGMVLGEREGMSKSLTQAMRSTGLTHLTAVSGTNCSVVFFGVMLLARTIRLPRQLAAASGIAMLLMFVVLTGADPSVLRAAVMGVLGVLALLRGRRKQQLSILSAVVIILLVIDPWLSISFGFLLSVLATLGLITVAPLLHRMLARLIPNVVAMALAVPLAAQLFCMPAIVLLNPQFCTYALLANLLAAPVVALCTLAGTVALPVLLIFPVASAPLLTAAGLCAAWVAGIARFCASLPGASLPWPSGVLGVVLMALLAPSLLLVLRLAPRYLSWFNDLPAGPLAHLARFWRSLVLRSSLSISVAGLGWLSAAWLAARLYGLPP